MQCIVDFKFPIEPEKALIWIIVLKSHVSFHTHTFRLILMHAISVQIVSPMGNGHVFSRLLPRSHLTGDHLPFFSLVSTAIAGRVCKNKKKSANGMFTHRTYFAYIMRILAKPEDASNVWPLVKPVCFFVFSIWCAYERESWKYAIAGCPLTIMRSEPNTRTKNTLVYMSYIFFISFIALRETSFRVFQFS